MTKTLDISNDLRVPLELATQATCIFGIRGAGKTNTASVIAEELLDAKVPVAIIDPTDAWWGLRSSRDGGHEGFPVFIFGGEHGDLPLKETDGKIIAEFVVTERVPVIMSLRHLRKGAQRRFVREFAEELYHLKGKSANRSPLTVIIDEAPLFVPKNPVGEVGFVVGAVEDLVARGRNAGIGVVLIGQRPVAVNADVRSICDTIITHRVTGPLDRKEFAKWLEENASVEQMNEVLGSLPNQKDGQAWVWSGLLGITKQVMIRQRRSFDSSATPRIGTAIKPPKKLAEVDRDMLRAKLAAAVQEADANDPKKLKERIAELERAVKGTTAVSDKATIDAAYRQGYGDAEAAAAPQIDYQLREAERLRSELSRIASAADGAAKALTTPPAKSSTRFTITPQNGHPKITEWKPRHDPRALKPKPVPIVPSGGASMPVPYFRILESAAWWRAMGVEKPTVQQLAAGAKYAASGTFDTYLSRMGADGLLVRERGVVTLTPAGWAKAPTIAAPTSFDEVHERVLVTLDGPSTRIITALIAAHGDGVPVAELADRSGYAASGTFDTYLSRLGSRGLLVRKSGVVTPTNVLFPETLR